MKKVLTAFIEQVLQFGDYGEYSDYLTKLKTGRPQQFKIMDVKKVGDMNDEYNAA